MRSIFFRVSFSMLLLTFSVLVGCSSNNNDKVVAPTSFASEPEGDTPGDKPGKGNINREGQ